MRHTFGLSEGHYILAGKEPVQERDWRRWAEWYQNADRHVGLDKIGKDIEVSTVFLGRDHRFSSAGPPILFETLVFGGDLDGEMRRYETWDEAEDGHKAMVERVRRVSDARTQ